MTGIQEPPRQGQPKGNRATGFTLLEVLAAVAILGIWFTVLAGVAIQGLRAEGRNTRLIRASLVADAALVELEEQIDNGTFPLEEAETEIDEFQIRVRPLPLSEVESQDPENDLSAYLAEALGPLIESMYQIEVEVAWIEGVDEQTLTRRTYGWDSAPYLDTLAGTVAPDADANTIPGARGGAGDVDREQP